MNYCSFICRNVPNGIDSLAQFLKDKKYHIVVFCNESLHQRLTTLHVEHDWREQFNMSQELETAKNTPYVVITEDFQEVNTDNITRVSFLRFGNLYSFSFV
jgi:hypothetical protein